MATIITPRLLRQISGKKFKGSFEERKELVKRAGEEGISHFQMKRELEDLGYDREAATKMVDFMCDLANERKQKNIKASRRLSNIFGEDQEDAENSAGYMQRKFAKQTSENKRDAMLKKINKGGFASAKNSDMNFLNKKPSVSALSSDRDKKGGFAGKLENKKGGFAKQTESSNNLTKSSENGVAAGIGSSPGGSGPMRL